MRLADLIRLGISYAVVGGIAAVFAIIAFLFGYKVVYQKCLHGTKKIGKWKAVWLILFVIYGVMLLGATFLSRGNFYTREQIVPLFASYREAWYQGQMSNVRNLMVNILMFVPFGFLVPIGIKRLKPFWKTYLAGLVVTVVIECLQIVTARGIFECDDILNNLVGTMIGYGVYTLFELVVDKVIRKDDRKTIEKGDRKSDKKRKLFKAIICQLPLLMCTVVIVVVCFAYQKQELGNLSIHYVTKVPANLFEIFTDQTFDSQRGRAFVYQVKEYSLPATRELAEQVLHKSGTDIHDNETDIYDETVFYRGTGKHISIDYKGGVYDYTNFDSMFSDGRLTEKTDGTREEILAALNDLGVEVPEGADFENQGNGLYIFTVNAVEKDGMIYDGHVSCTLMDDGSIARISNRIYVCTAYKEFDVISEEEALQRIQRGEFRFYFEEKDKADIYVQDVSLGYMLDSKSFYQPVYLFDITIDDREYQIPIPAIK